MNIDFKNDKSWFVIIILLFTVTPIGFIALFGKFIYMIYQSSGKKDESFEARTYNSQPLQSFKDLSEPLKPYDPAELSEEETIFEIDDSETMTIMETEVPLPEVTPREMTPIEVTPREMPAIEVTPREMPAIDDLKSMEALKVITCPMCGTENKIYKIDVFETPACEKCGMLLLER